MPRRSILSAADRENLLAIPDAEDKLIRLYTFSGAELSLIRQRRGDANRLGFAVQMCLLRFPGQGLLSDAPVSADYCSGSDDNYISIQHAGPSMLSVRKLGVSI